MASVLLLTDATTSEARSQRRNAPFQLLGPCSASTEGLLAYLRRHRLSERAPRRSRVRRTRAHATAGLGRGDAQSSEVSKGGRWSAIGYTVARFNPRDSERSKNGDTVFLGGGVAYTPNEDFQSGRLISYQAGWSFEHYARNQAHGQPDPNTGGDEVLLHPTLVYSPGHNLLFFGNVSVPVWRSFRDSAAQDGYRFGSGVVYGW